MASFSNPFAQFASPFATSNGASNGDESPVTLNYLTGLPDPGTIADSKLSLAVKGMLKKDARTKSRALDDFNSAITPDNVDDAVHLAFVQLYAKLSIDISPPLRATAHKVLGNLYTVLGKRSTKYLKYSVGPWLCGTFDPDTLVATAAQSSLAQVFPEPEKRQVLAEKLKQPLLDFIDQVIGSENVSSLSDERYVEPYDALAKYTRLVKTTLDVFQAQSWPLSDLGDHADLVWKFCASSDPALARTTLQMASARLSKNDIATPEVLGSELLKALRKLSPAPVDLLRTLTLYTKQHRELWKSSPDALVSLGAYIAHDPTRPASYWPLLFNLIVTVLGAVPAAEASKPLFKGLSKVAPKTAGDAEPEAWGCFLALAGRMELTSKALAIVSERTKRSISTALQASLARQVARMEPSTVEPFLDAKNLTFLKVVAAASTPALTALLSVKNLHAQQLAVLVPLNPSIEFVPENIDEDAASWAKVAAFTKLPDMAQKIVDRLVAGGYVDALLDVAPDLAQQQVHAEISLDDELDPERAAKAVAAIDKLVTRQTATQCLDRLATLALEGDSKALKLLVRAAKPAESFISHDLDPKVRDKLTILVPEDLTQTLSQILITTPTAQGITWDQLESDLNVLPASVTIYDLKIPLPETPEVVNWTILTSAAKLLEQHSSDENTLKAALIGSAARAWAYTAEDEEHRELATAWASETHDIRVPAAKLWELAGGKGWVAFHAAQTLYRMRVDELESFGDRKWFVTPSIRGALLAQRGIGRGQPWYDAYQRQLPVWYMCDPQSDQPQPKQKLDSNVAKAAWFSWGSSKPDLVEALEQGPSYLRLAALKSAHTHGENSQTAPDAVTNAVIKAARSVGEERSQFEDDYGKALLGFFHHPSATNMDVYDLLDSHSKYVPWIGYQCLPDPDPSLLEPHLHSPASWALYLMNDIQSDDATNARILDYCGKHLPYETTELDPPDKIGGYLLLAMSTQHGAALRMWYRELRDRQLRKRVDEALGRLILPAVMAKLSENLDTSEGMSINAKTHEIRAVREVDDAAVDIVITLPDQYPAKPADVDLKNLGGVPEAKKRAWMLEARTKLTAGDVLGAMKAIVSRLDSFLDGVEPCAICYSLLLDNKSLPNKTCPNCSNIYHTDCLYKWFHSQRDKLCPMCRQPL